VQCYWSKSNAWYQVRRSVDAAQRRFRARGAGGRLCGDSGPSRAHYGARRLDTKLPFAARWRSAATDADPPPLTVFSIGPDEWKTTMRPGKFLTKDDCWSNERFQVPPSYPTPVCVTRATLHNLLVDRWIITRNRRSRYNYPRNTPHRYSITPQ
jgi:hypothetical protein